MAVLAEVEMASRLHVVHVTSLALTVQVEERHDDVGPGTEAAGKALSKATESGSTSQQRVFSVVTPGLLAMMRPLLVLVLSCLAIFACKPMEPPDPPASATRQTASPTDPPAQAAQAGPGDAPFLVEQIKFVFKSSRVKGSFRATNRSSERRKAELCVRFYDRDGAQVGSASGDTVDLAPSKSDTVSTVSFSDDEECKGATVAKAYLAKYGCTDSPSEAVSNVLAIPPPLN